MRTEKGVSRALGSLLAAGLLLCATAIAARAAVSVDIGTGEGGVGDTVAIAVTLSTGGASVAGVQNDILFDPALVNLEKASDCVINPDIGDRAAGCEEDPPVGACKQLQRNLADCPAAAGCPAGSEGLKRFRAIVLSTSNVNEIPDGVVLYRCNFKVVSSAARSALLANLNIGASDPAGTALEATGVDGQIQIMGGEEPTPTPTEEPCPSPAPGGVVIQIGRANVEPPQETVQIAVSMVSDNASVAGVQNDILFDPAIVDLTKATDCVINPEIGDRAEGCEEDPPVGPCKQLQRNLAECPGAAGCPEGSTGLKRFRGIVLSTSNVNEIPDGVLYTCTFAVKATSGTAILQNLNFGASDPAGTALTAGGCNGRIVIGGATPPVETPTPTATEVPPTATEVPPTATQVPPTATQVVQPTATRTSVPVPTATAQRTPKPHDDDDGCQIVTPGRASAGWVLLIPLIGLLWLRRRDR